MSHFTVIVIGENIDEQLMPYQECSEDPRYRSFKSTEQEDMAEYLTGEIPAVILPDGTKTHEYDEKYRTYERLSLDSRYVFPEGSEHKSMKFSEYFSSFEEYKESWCGQDSRDEQTGEYGYWHNDNGKWDWYTVGGRWTGFFMPKPGARGELGESGSFGNKPRQGWVDSAKIKDIDFTAMINDKINQAHATYDKLEAVLQGRSIPSWSKILEENNNDVNVAREIYQSNPVKKALDAAQLDTWGDNVAYYKNSRQEFVASQASSVAVPFAVVKDGQWYEKGKMGWFGMSSGDKDQEQWSDEFWKLIKSLPEDTRLTLVDCHV